MAFGRRRSDKKQPKWDDLTPEQKAKAFDRNVSKHVVNAADKRREKKAPYDLEPEAPKGRGLFGGKKKK